VKNSFEYKTPFDTYTVWIAKRFYDNGRLALVLMDADGPIATATVNIPEQALGPDEVCIKTWSENEPMLAFLVENGIVQDTGNRAPAGFAEAAICKLLMFR